MDFWGSVLDWLSKFIGIDLIVNAVKNNQAIPAQAYLQLVFSSITIVLAVLYVYRTFYLLVGLFAKSRKYKHTDIKERYCYILSARNEEKVIGNLIDSIREQDYPQELIDIYVIADNCSPDDKTKEIAESKGCTVLVRNDPAHALKGYSLNLAIETIRKTVGLDKYYAYVFFDSDNVMAPDFLDKMNDCFHDGDFGVVMGYRNIKNLNENWLTSVSGMNFYRNVVGTLRPRSVLHVDVQGINGTGFAIRSDVMEKYGWNAFSISEDFEITGLLAAEGVRFAFCEEAEYYDEQPDTLKISLRQRLRWCKGGLMNFYLVGPVLLKSFFKKPTWRKYDIYWDTFPYALITFFMALSYQIASLILFLCVGDNGYNWSTFGNYLLTGLAGAYGIAFLNGLVLMIREWNKMYFTIPKAILALLVWPFYDMSSIILNVIALFWKPKWKPIPHKSVASGKDLKNKNKKK